MLDYIQGKGSADRRKTAKVVVSFLSDFFITICLMFTLMSYGRMDTYIALVVCLIIFAVLYRWLRNSGENSQQRAYKWLREKFPYSLPFFPLFSFIMEFFVIAVMPEMAYVHYYLSILAFFSQIWIIQRQVQRGF